jgi:hypothetical protein
LLHEWGNGQVGEEWVRVREEARSLFEHAGVLSPFHPGARSESAIEEALDGLRLVRETDVVLGPGPSITLREFLRRLTEGRVVVHLARTGERAQGMSSASRGLGGTDVRP